MPVVLGVRRLSWIWGEMDADAVRSVDPSGAVRGGPGACVGYGVFEPMWDQGDWPEETEDASQNRLLMFESFLDRVCCECGFPSVYPCHDSSRTVVCAYELKVLVATNVCDEYARCVVPSVCGWQPAVVPVFAN